MLVRPVVDAFTPNYHIAAFTIRFCLSTSGALRFFSVKPTHYIPHAFSFKSAVKRFAEADKNRVFAPLESEVETSTALTLFKRNPIRKALLPFYTSRASIDSLYYKADTFKTEHITETLPDGKVIKREKIKTKSISGKLGSHHYSPDDDNMHIYADFKWNQFSIENSIQGKETLSRLKPYDESSLEEGTENFEFKLVEKAAQDIAKERVRNAEKERVKRDIHQRISCDAIHITKLDIKYTHDNIVTLSRASLPFYILQHRFTPPRIMPAIRKSDNDVHGLAPVSLIKTVMFATFTTAAACAFVPEITFLSAVAAVALAAGAGASFARFGLSWNYRYDQYQINSAKKFNQEYLAIEGGEEEKTSLPRSDSAGQETLYLGSNLPSSQQQIKDGEGKNSTDSAKHKIELITKREYYDVLGLDTKEPVTVENVRTAYETKIKAAHPDTGTNGNFGEVLAAKKGFEFALKQKLPLTGVGRLHFCTFARTNKGDEAVVSGYCMLRRV